MRTRVLHVLQDLKLLRTLGMAADDPVVKYVGHKVSKVQWKPLPSGSIQSSEIFASGSWDDEVNRVCVWCYSSEVSPGDPTSSPSLTEPVLLCEREIAADTTDLKFLDEERIVGSFSNGCVSLFRYSAAMQALGMSQVWEGLHKWKGGQPAPCTALAVSGTTIVTGGEDGRMNIVRADDHHPLRTFENADNATITALLCTLQSEIISVSSSGQLKVWDSRRQGNKAVRVLAISGDHVSLHCLDRHPHQPHLVALGRSDGSVGFWDLRQEGHHLQIIQAHNSNVWDVKFHPAYPNNLFTCSQDGFLWHWDATANGTQTMGQAPPLQASRLSEPTNSPWLSGAVAQGKVEIVNYLYNNKLPVNSLDIESRHLLCGSDSEALFVVPDLTLR